MSETKEKVSPRLETRYHEEIAPALREKFGLKNVHQTPRLTKITVNMGVGKAIENKKRLDAAAKDLGTITGQRPQIVRAKRSVAGFKLREQMPISCRVTLRGHLMYEFLDRMLTLAVPRIRDFRGIKRKSFDGRGNFAMGLADQLVFPEIQVDRVEWNQGMDVCFTITGNDDAMSFELLTQLGVPFQKD
ncbi:MAG: 50S ribosomal protein L5 [Planctomycetes bacterium]|nr:50S ribosomal protein L5 [Planctomycetota bacterium]